LRCTDQIYELTQVTQSSNTTESYSYDPVGNRLSSLGVASYAYNNSNELTSTTTTSYTYDNNGNTLTKTDSTGTTGYAWDVENRLTSVTLPGSGGTVSFKYDPFGRRVEKISPSFTSVFAYDGDNLIETVNSSGGVVSRYSQGLNVDEPLAELRGSATSYYEADGLGSITSLTAANGSIAQSYTNDSFGKQIASSGSVSNPFDYTAREFDSETNLYYYRARYYDMSTGRFLSEDPIRFNSGQVNFYDYVANSPIINFDPTGLAYCQFILNGNAQSGYMWCFPGDPRKPVFGFPASSGNNGGGTTCKNNPDCAASHNRGPIPLGLWQWTNRPNSKGGTGGRSLEPVPNTATNQSEGRTGILSHWCANPFGPSTTPPFCSEGCVAASQSDIQALNNLLDSEPNSTLEVIQSGP
jgi:RHS repeat-associated protein